MEQLNTVFISAQHPQAAISDNNNIFEIGYIHNDCLVYWHEQAFNALPLPMMTHYTQTPHSFDIGICMDQNNRLLKHQNPNLQVMIYLALGRRWCVAGRRYSIVFNTMVKYEEQRMSN